MHEWIDEHIPRVRKIETAHCNVPLDLLLGAGDATTENRREPPLPVEAPNTATAFSSYTYTYANEQPISIDLLRAAIKKLPGHVIRCKGIIATQEDPHHSTILQAVGRRSTFDTGDSWRNRPPRSEIVIIGTADDFDPAELQHLLDDHLT